LACVVLAAVSSLLWLRQGAWSARGWGGLLTPLAASCTAGLVLLPAFAGGGATSLSNLLVTEAHADLVRALASWQGTWLAPAGLATFLVVSIIVICRELRPAGATAGMPGRRDAALFVAAALLAFACWRAPGILACLLAWTLGVAAARPMVAWLGLAGMVPYLFQLYYSLDTTLLGKGMALLAAGLLMLALRHLLRRAPLPAADPQVDERSLQVAGPTPGSPGPAADGRESNVAGPVAADVTGPARLRTWVQFRLQPPRQKALAVVGALVVLLAFNTAILQKERLLHDGRVVRLALAPVDPRAFMTGDYMALDYGVAAELSAGLAAGGDRQARDAFAIVTPDPQGVARSVRLQERADPLQPGEIALKARVRHGRVRLGTDAYYFQEGTGHGYEKARHGEFRVAADGEMLLVRLLDESLAALPAH
jgi:uncharacterized membrane-anchored protein